MLELSILFNFSVVVFVLWYYGRAPLAQYLSDRSDALAKEMAEASALSKEARQELDTWQKRWNGAKGEIAQQEVETKALLARQREMMIAHLKSESERVKHEAILVAQSENARAKRLLREEVAHRSVEVARKYLVGHLEDKDRHRLVSEYLEILRNGHSG